MKKPLICLAVTMIGLCGFVLAYHFSWMLMTTSEMNEASRSRFELLSRIFAIPSLLIFAFGFFGFFYYLAKRD